MTSSSVIEPKRRSPRRPTRHYWGQGGNGRTTHGPWTTPGAPSVSSARPPTTRPLRWPRPGNAWVTRACPRAACPARYARPNGSRPPRRCSCAPPVSVTWNRSSAQRRPWPASSRTTWTERGGWLRPRPLARANGSLWRNGGCPKPADWPRRSSRSCAWKRKRNTCEPPRTMTPARTAIDAERTRLDLAERSAEEREGMLRSERADLAAERDPKPVDASWLAPDRAGEPLWRCVDFTGQLTDVGHAGLEGALL